MAKLVGAVLLIPIALAIYAGALALATWWVVVILRYLGVLV
jgi:hypothetical protein